LKGNAMKKRFLIAILALCLVAAAAFFTINTISSEATPTAFPTAAPTTTQDSSEFTAVFEEVWNTVNQTYFDPEFGGLDWDGIRNEYAPLISSAEDDAAFYQLLNQMLWELNVSHAVVGPAELWSPSEPAIWMEGKIGIDVRLLDDQVVITRLEAGSSAEEAGLQPGFIIQSIDTIPVTQIIAEAEEGLAPPFNAQGRIDNLTRHLLGMIYGDPGTCVSLAYLDGNDMLHEECIERIQRPRERAMTGTPLPPAYLEFESKQLENGIGYIRFNTFHPDLIPDLIAGVASLQDASGIILDLRGNPGGEVNTAEQLAAQFLEGPASLGNFTTRSGMIERQFTGVSTYSGPLVILIDALSFSASEYFSSGLQTLGRAVIVGERSSGGVTGMNVTALSNGALLGYPVAQLVTIDGNTVEGTGIIPNITVRLNRSQLLEGMDAQLEAAIHYISTHSP
jgi:carboxyl-terminal processing protease